MQFNEQIIPGKYIKDDTTRPNDCSLKPVNASLISSSGDDAGHLPIWRHGRRLWGTQVL